MQETLGPQIGAAGVAVWLIQWLKSTKLAPFIHEGTDKLNRVLSALIAALATVGIHVEFDQTGGVLTVTGLTLSAALPLVWSYLQQLVMQEVIYRSAVKK